MLPKQFSFMQRRDSMFNPDRLKQQIGDIVEKYPHLDKLREIEDYIHERSPFPLSYDVSRVQPYYYTEFAYTEFLGGITIYPQNNELARRTVLAAVRQRKWTDFDPLEEISNRVDSQQTGDKYKLLGVELNQSFRVAVLPGSNMLMRTISKDILGHYMHRYPDLVVKPHPLTHNDDMRILNLEFGPLRILDPKVSGWSVVGQAKEVFTAPCSELSAYATLYGKPIRNIATIESYKSMSYTHLLDGCYDVPVSVAQKRLINVLRARSSGMIFASDPDWKLRVDSFFDLALKVRKTFKPVLWGSHVPFMITPPEPAEKK